MRRRVCMLASLLAVIVTVVNIAFFVKDSFFYSLENLPTGNPYQVDSSGENHRFVDQKYFFDPENGGYYILFYSVPATGHNPSGIRAEVGREGSNWRKTIYWQIGETANLLSWNDYTVVTINDVTIDFSKDTYDCRDYVDYKFKPFVLNEENGAQ